MPNWSKLTEKIYDKQDIALFEEAKKCFKTKAFRMAYIAIWICIAESLRNKITIMAQKDSVASIIVKKIQEKEDNHYPVDSFILEKSKKIGILDDAPFQKIKQILNMRNIYAHPYNMGPKREEVELAFIHAVEEVLSTPPLLRKPYIEKLLKNLKDNRHYLVDLEEKVVRFANDVIDKIAPHLYPYMFKGIIFNLDKVNKDPDKKIFQNRLIWFSRTFINNIKPDFSDVKWRLNDKFDDFPEAVTQILSDSRFWDMIPEDIQDKMLGWLLYPIDKEDGEGIVIQADRENVQAVFSYYNDGKLTSHQKERFLKWCEEKDLKDLGSYAIPPKIYIDRIISDLASHNWYTQNPAALCLWNLGPNSIEGIPENKLELLGRNILQSAEGDAIKSKSFLDDTIRESVKWPKFFIKGILYESFLNNESKFRCKYECLYKTLIIVMRCSKEGSEDILKDLLKDIERSTLKYGSTFTSGEKEAISKIEKVLTDLQGEEKSKFGELLVKLRSKLKELSLR